jgi:hypothetical protein
MLEGVQRRHLLKGVKAWKLSGVKEGERDPREVRKKLLNMTLSTRV